MLTKCVVQLKKGTVLPFISCAHQWYLELETDNDVAGVLTDSQVSIKLYADSNIGYVLLTA